MDLIKKMNAFEKVNFEAVKNSGLVKISEGYRIENSTDDYIKFTAFGREWEDRWYSLKAIEILAKLSDKEKPKLTDQHLGIMRTWIRENYQHGYFYNYPTKPVTLKKIGLFLNQIIKAELRDNEELLKSRLEDIDKLFINA